jgi:hypothetical protein
MTRGLKDIAMTLISRDPFARQELHRVLVETTKGCDWCGGKRRSGKKLFQYQTETDGGRTNPHKGLFCDKDCHDSYHG